MDKPKIEQSAANQELIDLIKPFLDPESGFSEPESKAKVNEIVKKYREHVCQKSNPKDDEIVALREGISECKEIICSRIKRKLHEQYPEIKNLAVTSRREQPKEQGDRYKKGLEKYKLEAKLLVNRVGQLSIRKVDDLDRSFISFVFGILMEILALENQVIRDISLLS